MKLFIDKYDIRYQQREWNNRRKAAAKRALKKERERAGLFGEELMRFKTVEERMDQVDGMSLSYARRMRMYEADRIKSLRKKLRSMPEHIREEILDYWNSEDITIPRKSHFLSDLITQMERDPKHIKRLTGEAPPYIKNIVINGKLKIVDIPRDEYLELSGRAIDKIEEEVSI